MPRPRSVYRGESRPVWILTLAVSVLAVLILFAVWLFYHMQQYMVYDKDGARLVLPSARGETQADTSAPAPDGADFTPIEVEIVVDKTDYSAAEGTDAEGLRAIHGRFVPAESVTEATLTAYASSMGGCDALALELKTASGQLSYASALPLAGSYAVNGTADLTDSIAKLREQNVYLIAQLSCLADGMMALRNAPAAMRDAYGAIYLQSGQAFLDPYREVTRGHLAGLLEELAALGFDEVLLTGLYLPADGENLRYSGEMTVQPDAESAVSSLAFFLREKADALGLRLSAAAEREGAGQDYAVFFKAFDRVAYDAADLEMRTALVTALGSADGTRIVPAGVFSAPESGSYLYK